MVYLQDAFQAKSVKVIISCLTILSGLASTAQASSASQKCDAVFSNSSSNEAEKAPRWSLVEKFKAEPFYLKLKEIDPSIPDFFLFNEIVDPVIRYVSMKNPKAPPEILEVKIKNQLTEYQSLLSQFLTDQFKIIPSFKDVLEIKQEIDYANDRGVYFNLSKLVESRVKNAAHFFSKQQVTKEAPHTLGALIRIIDFIGPENAEKRADIFSYLVGFKKQSSRIAGHDLTWDQTITIFESLQRNRLSLTSVERYAAINIKPGTTSEEAVRRLTLAAKELANDTRYQRQAFRYSDFDQMLFERNIRSLGSQFMAAKNGGHPMIAFLEHFGFSFSGSDNIVIPRLDTFYTALANRLHSIAQSGQLQANDVMWPVRQFIDSKGRIHFKSFGEKVGLDMLPSEAPINEAYSGLIKAGRWPIGEVSGEQNTLSPVSVMIHDLAHLAPYWQNPSMMKEYQSLQLSLNNSSANLSSNKFSPTLFRIKTILSDINETYLGMSPTSQKWAREQLITKGISESVLQKIQNAETFKEMFEITANEIPNEIKIKVLNNIRTHFFQLVTPIGGASNDIVTISLKQASKLKGWHSTLYPILLGDFFKSEAELKNVPFYLVTHTQKSIDAAILMMLRNDKLHPAAVFSQLSSVVQKQDINDPAVKDFLAYWEYCI